MMSRFAGRRALCSSTIMLIALAANLPAQRGFSISAAGAAAHHRVNGARGVEQSSGMLFGGEGSFRSGGWLEVDARMLSGSLTADSSNAETRDVSQGEFEIGVLPVPWIALQAGIETRTFATDLLRQRWIAARTGAEVRMALAGGAVQGIVRLALMPSVSVSGIDSPDLAIAAGSGIELDRGRITGAILYSFERFDFPANAAIRRREQFSTLSARIGLKLGR